MRTAKSGDEVEHRTKRLVFRLGSAGRNLREDCGQSLLGLFPRATIVLPSVDDADEPRDGVLRPQRLPDLLGYVLFQSTQPSALIANDS